ncbi:hypothetical protein ACIQLJ_00630 [Microbacterium sp. NPDC091313]
MTESSPPAGPVAPGLAVVFATVGFLALAIAGLGLASLFLNADVIGVRGLGQVPGATGMLLAAGAFAGALLLGVRAPHPSFWSAAIAALAAWLGEGIGVVIGGVVTGADPAAVVSAAGGVVVGWPGAVIAAAALVAGCGGVALTRTRTGRPRWPWERDDEE